ncbi:MAG: SDR family NAD(P)-dependent oxidoreductase, partial [Betaproteobacteria bacterium]|nr:SDR family NAD(P)-dependent oxidoreductase [Betaproteobacteria bacterium]
MAKRTVLVTGGMGGLGESICLKMANMGYTVVASHSPGRKDAEEWLAAMRKQGHNYHTAEVDVADYDSCARCVAEVQKNIGPVDVLVN